MRDDEIGMLTDKVGLISNKLDAFIKENKKNEYLLKTLVDKTKNCYSSNNSVTLNNNNGYVIDGIHVNTKNIESYNLYIMNKIKKYSNVRKK